MADTIPGATGASGVNDPSRAPGMGEDVRAGSASGAGAHAATLDADIAALKEDVSRLTDSISALLSDGAAATRTAAREGVETVRQRASDVADDLSESIEQNPLTAVLVAVGVGYVLGALGRRR